MNNTTTTETPKARTASIPQDLHKEATDLVRDLAAIAGNEAVITHKIRASLRKYDNNQEDVVALLAASLIVIFSECITTPASPGEYAETSFTNGSDL